MKRFLLAIGAGVALGVVVFFLLTTGKTDAASSAVDEQVAAASGGGDETARKPARWAPQRPARPEKPLPVSLTSAPVPSLVTDQNSPSYDAYRLIKTLDISVATLFDTEKRDPQWAPKREGVMTAIIDKDLQSVKANSRLVHTECRHSTCEMLFEGPTLEEARWGSLLVQYAPLGTMTEMGQPVLREGKVYLPVFLALQPEERPNEGFEQIYQLERRAELTQRRQSGPPPPGFPPYPED